MMSSDVLGLLLRPSADYNLRHKTVAFRLGWPFATTLDRCLQLRLYTTCESSDMIAAFRLGTPVAKLLVADPSADCNFRRAQTATMVVASCAYSDSRIKTTMDVWLHMRLHTSCNSDNQPIATLIIHKLQLCWYQTRLV